jgi:hypothetical protein
MALAKRKTLLRQAPKRIRDGLWLRIGEFTSAGCANFLQPSDYADPLRKYVR